MYLHGLPKNAASLMNMKKFCGAEGMLSITERAITVLMYKRSIKKGNAGLCSKMILTQLVRCCF